MSIVQDLKYALRLMRKKPGFALAIVLALTLANGANTAIFSLVYSVLYRPLPYEEPDALVAVFEQRPRSQMVDGFVSTPDYLDWKQQNQVFENMGAFAGGTFDLTGIDEPERLVGGRVSASFFPTLGVQPLLGRLFTEEEDKSDTGPVLLSHSLWARRFGSDPAVLGRSVTLSGNSHTVVGVLPAGFHFLTRQVELWLPISFTSAQKTNRGMHWLQCVARLDPGHSLRQAQANMDTVARRLEAQYPDKNTGHGAYVVSLRSRLSGDLKTPLLMLLGSVGLVLLIACANVASLLLVRASERKKEIAIRLAVGVTRTQLLRQLICESLVFAVAGGIGGLILASSLVQLMLLVVPVNPNVAPVPGLEDIRIDVGVYLFSAAVTLLTGLCFGIAPAMQWKKLDICEILKQPRDQDAALDLGRGFRLSNLLIVAELTLAMSLVLSAGLLVKSFHRVNMIDLGFRSDRVLTMLVTPPQTTGSMIEELRLKEYFRVLVERLNSLPGVTSVGAVANLPLSGRAATRGVSIQGVDLPAGDTHTVRYNVISPGYLSTLQIPVRKGRDFVFQDTMDTAKVALINEKMAQLYWAHEDPIGHLIKFGSANSERPWMTVVGVVGNVRDTGVRAEVSPEVYLPLAQIGPTPMTLVIATQRDPLSLAAAARHVIRELDSSRPVAEVRTMDQLVSEFATQPRLYAVLLTAFAALALTLAVVGVFGVISYSLAQRRREMGIRLALGATPRGLVGMIVGRGSVLVAAGLVLGLLGALSAAKVLRSMLYQVSTTDVTVIVAATTVVACAALAACYIPARRSAVSNPTSALREE